MVGQPTMIRNQLGCVIYLYPYAAIFSGFSSLGAIVVSDFWMPFHNVIYFVLIIFSLLAASLLLSSFKMVKVYFWDFFYLAAKQHHSSFLCKRG